MASGGKEKKRIREEHIVIAARRAAVSIAREARLVSNLTRRGARRKLTAVEGDRRFSIDSLKPTYRACFSISIATFPSSGNKFGEQPRRRPLLNRDNTRREANVKSIITRDIGTLSSNAKLHLLRQSRRCSNGFRDLDPRPIRVTAKALLEERKIDMKGHIS